MILRQHNALVVILSDANLTKISPPLHWAMLGQLSVNPRLNFGRKGGKEAGCLSEESCLEQGMSRSDDRLELSRFSLESGDWYVRHRIHISEVLHCRCNRTQCFLLDVDWQDEIQWFNPMLSYMEGWSEARSP